jgi:hypothetical protein
MKSIIAGYLELISIAVLDDYHDEKTCRVAKQQATRLNYKAKFVVTFDTLLS